MNCLENRSRPKDNLDESMKNMYHSFFEHAMKYDSINTMLPCMFLKY